MKDLEYYLLARYSFYGIDDISPNISYKMKFKLKGILRDIRNIEPKVASTRHNQDEVDTVQDLDFIYELVETSHSESYKDNISLPDSVIIQTNMLVRKSILKRNKTDEDIKRLRLLYRIIKFHI